jgi:hypothetical protein
MQYRIRPYQRYLANRLNVDLKPSNKRCAKIDIFDKQGNYLTSIGDKRYNDYLGFVEDVGYDHAERRKELYWKRHKKENVPGTRGFYALHILWS